MQTNNRLHALDAIRALALFFGVIAHATMAYMPDFVKATGSPIIDVSQGWLSAVIFFIIHIFRLTMFFVVAGFFARLVFHRLGTKEFIKVRGKRIAIPFVVGFLVLTPLVALPVLWAILENNHGVFVMPKTPNAKAGGIGIDNFPVGHLWFLYYLLVAYAVAVPARNLIARFDSGGAFRARIDGIVHWLGSNPVSPIVLAVPMAIVFYFLDKWMMWFGVTNVDASLIPRMQGVVGYGIAFVFGWLLHRQPQIFRLWEKRGMVYLAVSLLLTAACLVLHGMDSVAKIVPTPEPSKLLYIACYTIGGWTWTFAVIGLGMKYFSDESPLRRYLADSSYWVYIAHLPLVYAFQVLMMKWPIYWAIKFTLLLVVTHALLFVMYHYWVRPTFIGEMLNGRKFPRSPLLAVWRASLDRKAPPTPIATETAN